MGPTVDPAAWQEIRPRQRLWERSETGELWTYRHVLVALVRRELTVRYKQTLLGSAWAVVQPLLGALLFSLVFGRLAGLPSDGLPYTVFVYSGLLLWTYVSASILSSTRALVDNRDLVTKIYFPRLLVPIASAVPKLIDLGISLVAYAVIAAIAGVGTGWGVLLLPVWILLAVLLAIGVGALFGAANVRYRDVGEAMSLFLQLWLFASPVVFASSAVDGPLRTLLSCNPVTGLLDGFRFSLAGAPPPPLSDLLSLASGVVLVVAGLLYFDVTERRFADLV